jgi:hypothetical protein
VIYQCPKCREQYDYKEPHVCRSPDYMCMRCGFTCDRDEDGVVRTHECVPHRSEGMLRLMGVSPSDLDLQVRGRIVLEAIRKLVLAGGCKDVLGFLRREGLEEAEVAVVLTWMGYNASLYVRP